MPSLNLSASGALIASQKERMYGSLDVLVAPYSFPPKNPESGAESRIILEFCRNMFEPEHQIVTFTTGTGIRIRNWTGSVMVDCFFANWNQNRNHNSAGMPC